MLHRWHFSGIVLKLQALSLGEVILVNDYSLFASLGLISPSDSAAMKSNRDGTGVRGRVSIRKALIKRSSRIFSAVLGATLLLVGTGCGGGSATIPPEQNQSPLPPPAPQSHTSVTTYRNNNARTGANSTETSLTPSNVNVVTFGRLAAVPVTGAIYAQPLYVPGVTTADGKSHNLVFVATEHDQVYGIDADTYSIVWHKDFLGSTGTVTTLSDSDVNNCPAINPEVGITGTPVIDASTSTMYLVAATKDTSSGDPVFYQRLHALDIRTGEDNVSPFTVATPTDPNGQYGVAQFSPVLNNQRSALLLANGQVYIAWASNCDIGAYEGWVMSFDAGTLQPSGAWTPSPAGILGGIWMGGSGPAADENGDVYLAVGNGWSDAMSGGTNYGDSVVRLRNSGNQISTVDYFTPFNWQTLLDDDLDLGSGGPVLLPDQAGATHPHLLAVAGKDVNVFLLDRDNLGQWQPDNNNQVVQTFAGDAQAAFSTPAFWNNYLYFGWYLSPVEAFRYDPASQQLNPTPVSTTGSANGGYPGYFTSISSNGNADGILWALRLGDPADFRAFNALNLGSELWGTEMSPLRDDAGATLTFAVPTVADGRVFVGARNQLAIYGLLSQ